MWQRGKKKTPTEFAVLAQQWTLRTLWMSYLVLDVSTACVMLLQGVNEKPFCCQCHIITPFGSYLKSVRFFLCMCVSAVCRACSPCSYVRVTVCYHECVCTSGGSVCMRVCSPDWTLHPRDGVQILSCVTSTCGMKWAKKPTHFTTTPWHICTAANVTPP